MVRRVPASPRTGQLGSNQFLFVRQNCGIKNTGVLGVLQYVAYTGAVQSQSQDRAQVVPMPRQVIPLRSHLQKNDRLLLPGLRRFQTQDPAFRFRIATPKTERRKGSTVAGCLGQYLFAVGKEPRITRDPTRPAPPGTVLPRGASACALRRSAAAQTRAQPQQACQKNTPLFSSSSIRSPIISTLKGVIINVLVATRLIWPLFA